MKNLPPALDRGLRLHRYIAEAAIDGQSFSNCAEFLGTTNAVTSALLHALAQYKWVKKGTDGRWHNAYEPTMPWNPIQELVQKAGPTLAELAAECTATALLITHEQGILTHAAKVLHEDGLVMRPVGSMRSSYLSHPWGWAVAYALSIEERRTLLAAEQAQDIPTAARKQLQKNGWCSQLSSQGNRLATALYQQDGSVIGALVLGGSFASQRLQRCASTLLRHAAKLNPPV